MSSVYAKLTESVSLLESFDVCLFIYLCVSGGCAVRVLSLSDSIFGTLIGPLLLLVPNRFKGS